MVLRVLGSSSSGNAYILENVGEALLIEAGVNFKKVVAALEGNISKVVGCLITHEHGDHAGRINEVLNAVIPVYATQGTIDNAKVKSEWKPRTLEREGNGYKVQQIGGFKVIPFATKHDCAEPVGFYIWHPETGGILFATDTYYLPNTFKGLNNVLIECNYDPEILDRNVEEGRLIPTLRERVRESHLSIDTCIDALKANDLKAVNNIVLIHLSAGNGDPVAFKDRVYRATGKRVHIAAPDLVLTSIKRPSNYD